MAASSLSARVPGVLPTRPVPPRRGDSVRRGELRVVARMAEPQHVGLTSLCEAFLAVFADRLQEPVTSLGTGVGDDEGPGNQARDQLEHVVRVDRLERSYASAASSVHPPENTAKARQQTLFGLGQQFVGPVDRGAKRLVPFDRDSSPPPRSRNRRSRRRANSFGFIAGIRAAASSIANATPSRCVHTATTSARLVASTVKSALTAWARSANRRTASHSLPRLSAAFVGEPQTRDHQYLLSGDVETLAAGSQHPHPRHAASIATTTQPPPAADARSCPTPPRAPGRAGTRPGVLQLSPDRALTGTLPLRRREQHPDRAPPPAHRATRHPETEATRRPRPATPSGSCRPRPPP